MVRSWLALVAVGVVVAGSCCATPIRYEGARKGKIVDASTGEPIEGAVVLAVWYTVIPTPAGGSSQYHDAQEAVSDSNGDFTIPGIGVQVTGGLNMYTQFVAFKAGYQYLRASWDSASEGPDLAKGANWEGDRAVVPIKKLTMEQRKKRVVDSPFVPDNKQPFLIREINKERSELGLRPL